MKPAPFKYHDPATIAEALDLLAAHEDARPLAGGQSLVPMLNFRFVQPGHLVDLNTIEELNFISRASEDVTIGAMTRQRMLERSSGVADALPIFPVALAHVGHRQTRARGTIGGSLCHFDPSAELCNLAALHDAQLTIMRKGQDKPVEVSITRDIIRVRSVRSNVDGEDVGYIRLTQFNEQTNEGLKKAIADIKAKFSENKLKGFVLDLRNNPGGLLDQAVSVSDTFLDHGEIVSTRGRNAEETQRFNARAGDLAKGKPIIVMVNGGSASASEIVAGALQDHKRATVIGTRSFGKGSVQTIIPLGAGNGALRLTTARYYTPSGKSIQAKGIVPDIEVLQDVPEELKARTDTKGESSLRGHLKADGEEQTGSQSYIPPDPKDDKALKQALDLIRGIKTHAAYPPNPRGTAN